MKTKLFSKILGVGLAIGLVFALGAAVIPAGEAQADEMEWGPVNTPSMADFVIAPGTDIFEYAVGPDGETVYAIGAITSCDTEVDEIPNPDDIRGLTGEFYFYYGEATVTRISNEVAEIEGWLEGDSCGLMGDFTLATTDGGPFAAVTPSAKTVTTGLISAACSTTKQVVFQATPTSTTWADCLMSRTGLQILI